MANKELIEKVAKAINGPFRPVPEGSLFTLDQLRDVRWQQINGAERNLCLASAQAAISTILAAIAEADTAMLDAGCKAWGVDINADETRENIANEWRQMLAASALGEQSDG
jgi:hypothetical protein